MKIMISAFLLNVLIIFMATSKFAYSQNCPNGWTKKMNSNSLICSGGCKPITAKLSIEAPQKVMCTYIISCQEGYMAEEKNGKQFCVKKNHGCDPTELPFKKGNANCCQKPLICQQGYHLHESSKQTDKGCDEFKLERCFECSKNEVLTDTNDCKAPMDSCEKGYSPKVFPGGIGCMSHIYECPEGTVPKINLDSFECVKK